MNIIGIMIVGVAVLLFVLYCLADAAQKADDAMERQGFARFETRSPGLTDVDDCFGKDCRTCEKICAAGIERLR